MILLKPRKDIPTEFTWDLKPLYPDQAAWEKDLDAIRNLADQLAAQKGHVTESPSQLLEALTLMDSLSLKLEWAGSYARLSFDVDMGNALSKKNFEIVDNLGNKISDQLAFYEPELLTLTPEDFSRFLRELPELKTYSFMFEQLFKEKEHILTPDKEEILSRMSAMGSSFRKIYDDLTVNDLSFPEIEGEAGEKITANEVYYRKMMSSYNRDARERYFRALLGTYGSHLNSLTSVENGNVKYRVSLAKTRKYASSREMALSGNHIPLSVYDTLVDTVRSNVHLLQRYLALRKKILHIDDLRFYDLFVPLVSEVNKAYTYDEARATVLQALSVLGGDYQSILQEAFAKRWIDVYPNKGKTSGAYATGIYALHPYSLLNFNGTMEDLFTMAHELGHVMHSYYSNKNQPYVDSDYVIFTAEVASTVNEYFLYQYLLEKAASKDERAYLLSTHLDGIRSTLYRQTFFADFEKTMHEMAEKDIPLTPETLCGEYRELYEFYHGPGFVVDEELTWEWARIPHFYSSFYVYQYATGISAAISLAKGILAKKEPAREAYLRFLTRGGSDYPINLLKEAGVDMSGSAPIIAALEDFTTTLDLLEQTLNS